MITLVIFTPVCLHSRSNIFSLCYHILYYTYAELSLALQRDFLLLNSSDNLNFDLSLEIFDWTSIY